MQNTYEDSFHFPQNHYLNNTQHLKTLLYSPIQISHKTQPQISVTTNLHDLLVRLVIQFEDYGLSLSDDGISMVGSTAAKLITVDDRYSTPNDIDVSIVLKEPPHDFRTVLYAEEAVLSELVMEQLGIDFSLSDCYSSFIRESVFVSNECELWSLICIGNENFSIDIKIIHKLSRKYAFSVDSFEIVLSEFLFNENSCVPVRSSYPNYIEAMFHLIGRRLYTQSPSSIRRGFFRYCLELARGFMPRTPEETMLYEAIFMAGFYKEFENTTPEEFECVLMKFISKHKKNWVGTITHMQRMMLANYHLNKINAQFLPILQKKWRLPN